MRIHFDGSEKEWFILINSSQTQFIDRPIEEIDWKSMCAVYREENVRFLNQIIKLNAVYDAAVRHVESPRGEALYELQRAVIEYREYLAEKDKDFDSAVKNAIYGAGK